MALHGGHRPKTVTVMTVFTVSGSIRHLAQTHET